MGLAAEDFAELISSLGLTGSAADNLDGILGRLSASTAAAAAAARADAAAAKVAAAAGVTAAQVKATLASATNEAAAAARKAAAEAASQKKADEALMATNLKAMAARDKQAATEAKAAAATKTAAGESGEAAKGQDELAASFLASAGASTQAGGTFGKVQQVLAKLGPEGQAVAVALGAIVLVATAVIGTLAKLAEMAIEASQAKMQLRESIGAFFGTGEAGGRKFLAELDAVSKRLPYTGQKIREWAQPLIDARIRGALLQRSIEAIAASTAMMGERGGQAASGLIRKFDAAARMGQRVWLSPDILEQLSQAGISSEVLAKELGVLPNKLQLATVKASTLGDVMARVLVRQGAKSLALVGQNWTNIQDKIREGMSSAFADLGDVVAPFMHEVQLLASELFKDSVASKGLGGTLRAILEPAFKAATAGVRWLHIAFLQVEIAALKVYIALRPLGQWLEKVGAVSFATGWGMLALKVLGTALAVVFGLLGLAVFLVALPFILVVGAIFAVVFALSKLFGLIGEAIANLDNLGNAASEAAGNFVSGLVDGITSGAGRFVDAVKNMAKQGLLAFTSFFQISSPSRLMKRHAKKDIAEDAAAAGIEEGTPKVKAAMGKMVAIPKGKGGKGGGGGDRVFAPTFTGCTFGAGWTESGVREVLSQWWEELLSSGPEPEGAA